GDEQGQVDDSLLLPAGDDGVDHAAGEQRGGDREQCGGRAQQHEQGDPAAVRAGEAADAAQCHPCEGTAFLCVQDAVQLCPRCGLHAHGAERRTSSNVEVKLRGAKVPMTLQETLPTGAPDPRERSAVSPECAVGHGGSRGPARTVRRVLCVVPLLLVTVVAVRHRSVLADGFAHLPAARWPWLLAAAGATCLTWVAAACTRQGAVLPRLPARRLLATQFAAGAANHLLP